MVKTVVISKNKRYITFVIDLPLIMTQSCAESTRDTYNYGQYLNQFPPEYDKSNTNGSRRKYLDRKCLLCSMIIYIYIPTHTHTHTHTHTQRSNLFLEANRKSTYVVTTILIDQGKRKSHFFFPLGYSQPETEPCKDWKQ